MVLGHSTRSLLIATSIAFFLSVLVVDISNWVLHSWASSMEGCSTGYAAISVGRRRGACFPKTRDKNGDINVNVVNNIQAETKTTTKTPPIITRTLEPSHSTEHSHGFITKIVTPIPTPSRLDTEEDRLTTKPPIVLFPPSSASIVININSWKLSTPDTNLEPDSVPTSPQTLTTSNTGVASSLTTFTHTQVSPDPIIKETSTPTLTRTPTRISSFPLVFGPQILGAMFPFEYQPVLTPTRPPVRVQEPPVFGIEETNFTPIQMPSFPNDEWTTMPTLTPAKITSASGKEEEPTPVSPSDRLPHTLSLPDTQNKLAPTSSPTRKLLISELDEPISSAISFISNVGEQIPISAPDELTKILTQNPLIPTQAVIVQLDAKDTTIHHEDLLLHGQSPSR